MTRGHRNSLDLPCRAVLISYSMPVYPGAFSHCADNNDALDRRETRFWSTLKMSRQERALRAPLDRLGSHLGAGRLLRPGWIGAVSRRGLARLAAAAGGLQRVPTSLC